MVDLLHAKLKLLLYIQLIITLFFFSCKEEKEELTKAYYGYNYFPIENNTVYSFKIDSIAFDDFTGSIDTFFFYRQYRILNQNLDISGRNRYQVQIWERTDSSSSWIREATFYWIRDTKRIEEQIGNLSSIPIIFPVQKDLTWNTNLLNTIPERNYLFSKVHEANSFEGQFYDSVAVVIEEQEENLIEKKISKSYYAAKYGLVYREKEDLRTSLNGTILSGFKFKQIRL